MATPSPGARLRETISKVVAIGAAVSGEAEKIKAEAAAQHVARQAEGQTGGSGAGVQPGA